MQQDSQAPTDGVPVKGALERLWRQRRRVVYPAVVQLLHVCRALPCLASGSPYVCGRQV